MAGGKWLLGTALTPGAWRFRWARGITTRMTRLCGGDGLSFAGGFRGAKPRSEPLEAVAAAPQTLATGQIIDFTDAEHAERPVPLRCPSWSVRAAELRGSPIQGARLIRPGRYMYRVR